MPRRAAIARRMVGPSVRTMRWVSLGPVAALAALVVRGGARDAGDPVAIALPVATVVLGSWLCLSFDDAAFEIAGSAPTPVWLRHTVRGAIAVPVVSGVWIAITFIGPLDGPTESTIGMGLAVAIGSLSCAAVSARRTRPDRSGVTAAAALAGVTLALPVAVALILERPITVDPSRPVLGSPLAFWSTYAGIALVVLIAAHRDPASGRLHRPPRPSRWVGLPARSTR